MTKQSFNLRNVVAIAICLAGFSTNSVLAQKFNYTDASGVTCEYEIMSYTGTYDDGEFPIADMTKVITMPASVTKWVVPETVVHNSITYRMEGFNFSLLAPIGTVLSSTLTEVVYPKYMKTTTVQSDVNDSPWPNLRKVTFGEYFRSHGSAGYAKCPLDSVIFLGDRIFQTWDDCEYGLAGWLDCFEGCPTTTKIIVPCGKRWKFEFSMNCSRLTVIGIKIIVGLLPIIFLKPNV
jgi:hypothetical protein